MRTTLLLCVAGCAPVLPDNTPYVEDARILAVQIEPAEAAPDAEIQITALAADETGALSQAVLDWDFCLLPKPLAELGPVASACLDKESQDLAPIGTGLQVVGQVPLDTCSLFGPNPPPPREGEPSGRPADPDVTGGFYQPILGFLEGGAPILAAVRTRCGIANVSQETFVAWNQSYLSNSNPTLAGLLLGRGEEETSIPPDGEDTPPTVSVGEVVTLSVRWPSCPAEVGVCGGAETYVVYNPETDTLPTRREALSATWFATGGTFDEARNGRNSDDLSTRVSNGWTAPDAPGEVWLAVVLRDERGGVSFQSYRLTIN